MEIKATGIDCWKNLNFSRPNYCLGFKIHFLETSGLTVWLLSAVSFVPSVLTRIEVT